MTWRNWPAVARSQKQSFAASSASRSASRFRRFRAVARLNRRAKRAEISVVWIFDWPMAADRPRTCARKVLTIDQSRRSAARGGRRIVGIGVDQFGRYPLRQVLLRELLHDVSLQ